MDSVRIAVIGTSWWADLIYLPVLSAYERADLCAICGRSPDPAQAMAAKYSIPQVYHDYHRMIAEADLDAVVISTPDDTHYDMVMAALDAGLHVLCEKPVALNADHARQMAEKASSTGLKTLVFFTWRWMPQFQYIHQLMDEGYLGQPYHADIRTMAGYARNDAYSWRLDGDRANGVLADLGSHIVDLARWYFGEVRSVSAVLGNYRTRQGPGGGPLSNPANDSAALLLEFANGAHASLHCSAVVDTGKTGGVEFTLYGAQGTLRSRQSFDNPTYKAWGVNQPGDSLAEIPLPANMLRHADPDNALGLFMHHSVGPRGFVDAILNDHPTTPNLYDGFYVQQVIDAALESYKTGQRILIDHTV